MQETLRLDITANNKNAIAGLKQTDVALQQVASTSLKTGQTVAKGSNQAAFALTNLGRVAQDAPFGFIGIQNNLNPLLESFQRLKSESGSTGGALKALAGSLMGPAGLGLALSVGSALLLTFGDRLFNTKKVTEETGNAYTGLSEIISQSNKEAGKEIINTKYLFAAISNVNLSMNERIAGIKQLRSEYPDLLANVTNEKMLAGDTAAAYKLLTVEIINNARAKVGLAKISELEAVKLEAEERKLKIMNATTKELSRTQEFAAKNKWSGGISGGMAPVDVGVSQEKKILERRAGALAVQDNIIKKATETQNFYEQVIGKTNLAKAAETSSTTTNTTAIKANTEAKKENFKYDEFKGHFQPLVKADMPELVNTESIKVQQGSAYNDILAARIKIQDEDNAMVAQANSLAEIGAGVFTDLGNAMLTGQDMGEALANTFKKLAADLAQMVIKALLFKAIMAVIGGGALPVPESAIPLALPGFADGGIASGPKSGYPALLHGTEAVLNPGQFKNLTSNMMNMGAMQGKSNDSGGFVASTSIRGSEMLLMIKRAEANMGLKRG
jgi:hypothetical protein